jgi:ABC-type glycerol-3-phosphate transport system substrate-binding protein
MTKNRFLNLTFSHNIEQFVDWDSGTVHFDSEEFIELLKLSDLFPLESDQTFHFPSMMVAHDAIAAGHQIIAWLQFMGFNNYRISRTMFGGEIVFKGFPGDNGRSGMFSISGDVAITEQSKHKQGAWEFVKLLISEDFGRDNINHFYGAFPVNKALFEELIADAMDSRTDRQLELGDPITGQSLIIPVLSAEEVGQITALIDSIDGVLDRDEMLMNIISESAYDFFKGQTTASDAAKVIQSRASIYMSEQR